MEVAGGSVSAYCFATIFATVVQLYTRVPVSRNDENNPRGGLVLQAWTTTKP